MSNNKEGRICEGSVHIASEIHRDFERRLDEEFQLQEERQQEERQQQIEQRRRAADQVAALSEDVRAVLNEPAGRAPENCRKLKISGLSDSDKDSLRSFLGGVRSALYDRDARRNRLSPESYPEVTLQGEFLIVHTGILSAAKGQVNKSRGGGASR